jgi:hypothetical protein
MAERELDHALEEDEPDENGVALPERDVMSLVGGTSLFASPLLDPTQTLAGDPAAGTPAAGATDPNAGVANATDNVSSLAQTAQQSDSGAVAQNIDSAGSVSSATTPPPQPGT